MVAARSYKSLPACTAHAVINVQSLRDSFIHILVHQYNLAAQTVLRQGLCCVRSHMAGSEYYDLSAFHSLQLLSGYRSARTPSRIRKEIKNAPDRTFTYSVKDE